MGPYSPLFHIHSLDIQEDRVFSDISLVHTVFSSDLAGEYSPQSTVHQAGIQKNRMSFRPISRITPEETISLFSEDEFEAVEED